MECDYLTHSAKYGYIAVPRVILLPPSFCQVVRTLS